MDTTIFLSQSIGIISLVMSLGLALQPQHYQAVFRELMSQPGLKFLTGVIPLIIGTLLILIHHSVQNRWAIFIEVVCWAIFIKGCMRILIPKISDRMVLKCIDRAEYVKVSTYLGIIIGLVLCYHGFLEGLL